MSQKIPVRRISDTASRSSSPKFSIRQLEKMQNGKRLFHSLHRHDFVFILALERGSGTHEIDFEKYAVTNQSIFILRPGQVHSLELSENSRGYLLEFDPEFYQPKDVGSNQRWKKASGKNCCIASSEGFNRMYSYLTNIFNEVSTKSDAYLQAIVANLDLFFIEYSRQSRLINNIDKPADNFMQDRLDELMYVLEKNIATMKRAAQYARLLNLSSYQLNAITKSSVGKTVSELINEQILLEAKRHLLATRNQVKDIADHLGYEDVSYFIRFFKKKTGYTPELFRKNFK